jgi:hypothetical protein
MFFSLIIPAVSDREKFNVQVSNVCSVLDDKIPGCYEIITIEKQPGDSVNEWDHVKGEVLVIIDGDLQKPPTTLNDIVGAFEDGTDMAFAEQYPETKDQRGQPDISYFGIKRSSLPKLHESPEGQRLILEILGPENIKKLQQSTNKTTGGYILGHLKKIIGLGR